MTPSDRLDPSTMPFEYPASPEVARQRALSFLDRTLLEYPDDESEWRSSVWVASAKGASVSEIVESSGIESEVVTRLLAEAEELRSRWP